MKVILIFFIFTAFLFSNEKQKASTFTQLKKDFFQTHIDKINDEETEDSLKQIVTSDFNLYPYKKNYFLPLSYDTKKRDDREQFETVFQLSVEKPFAYNIFGLDESLSFAYTQKSFWQTSAKSAPFRETNYQPEVFMVFSSNYLDEKLKAFKISLLHESNGRMGQSSRSWNRMYIETYIQYSNLFFIPRLWYRIPEKNGDDDNPNIYNYLGYGDITFLYPYKQYTVEVKIRNNLKLSSKNKGMFQVDWTFPLEKLHIPSKSFGFIRIFSGYAESLIDYDKKINSISFGIALSR
ncbi:MAG: phospholipase [Arcobacter sp.]|nr:MAG: phospholipase [Arcobacter sp.]